MCFCCSANEDEAKRSMVVEYIVLSMMWILFFIKQKGTSVSGNNNCTCINDIILSVDTSRLFWFPSLSCYWCHRVTLKDVTRSAWWNFHHRSWCRVRSNVVRRDMMNSLNDNCLQDNCLVFIKTCNSAFTTFAAKNKEHQYRGPAPLINTKKGSSIWIFLHIFAFPSIILSLFRYSQYLCLSYSVFA